MSRIRTIKPDFFSDEDIAELPFDIQRFYIGLWTEADKSGRLEDRPRRLAVKLMAYYPKFDTEKALDALSRPKSASGSPFIQRYSVNGGRYIQIVAFHEHQRPHHTEAESTLPPPPPLEEGKVKEGNGECSEPECSATEPLHNGELTVKQQITLNRATWEWDNIAPSDICAWKEAYPACDISLELARMREWIKSNPAKGHKSNWRAFITRWLTRSQDRGGSRLLTGTDGPDPWLEHRRKLKEKGENGDT